jgi:phosphoenolpyruvate synthase/pyruvate phosphate dikinase
MPERARKPIAAFLGALAFHRQAAMQTADAANSKCHCPGQKSSICAEHGINPTSIAFCQQVGLDDASCSPYRVPIARLAAAQAAPDAGGDRTA